MQEGLDTQVACLIRQEIRDLSAYHVAPSNGLIKLDAMENPYGWPAELAAQWAERIQQVALNRYPDPRADKLRDQLRQVMNIPADYDLLFGNGSDEIIQILALALHHDGGGVLAPTPGFVMYDMISRFTELPFHGVPLDPNFDLDLPAMLAAISEHQPDLIYLAQPNNPTGNCFSQDKVEAVINAANGLVVLDEAYMAFTQRQHLDLLARYHNVVVMRTLSKVGLAGLRFGFLVAAPAWISQFEKIRLPYNINVLTQASVAFALEHYSVLQSQAKQVVQDRTTLAQSLQALDVFEVFPSEANFLLARLQNGSARAVFEGLRERGVLIKCLDGTHPALQNCLRFTVGNPAENQALMAALEDCLASL